MSIFSPSSRPFQLHLRLLRFVPVIRSGHFFLNFAIKKLYALGCMKIPFQWARKLGSFVFYQLVVFVHRNKKYPGCLLLIKQGITSYSNYKGTVWRLVLGSKPYYDVSWTLYLWAWTLDTAASCFLCGRAQFYPLSGIDNFQQLSLTINALQVYRSIVGKENGVEGWVVSCDLTCQIARQPG